jgi:hypothetical protein
MGAEQETSGAAQAPASDPWHWAGPGLEPWEAYRAFTIFLAFPAVERGRDGRRACWRIARAIGVRTDDVQAWHDRYYWQERAAAFGLAALKSEADALAELERRSVSDHVRARARLLETTRALIDSEMAKHLIQSVESPAPVLTPAALARLTEQYHKAIAIDAGKPTERVETDELQSEAKSVVHGLLERARERVKNPA